jgi:hypothetical protein
MTLPKEKGPFEMGSRGRETGLVASSREHSVFMTTASGSCSNDDDGAEPDMCAREVVSRAREFNSRASRSGAPSCRQASEKWGYAERGWFVWIDTKAAAGGGGERKEVRVKSKKAT